MQKIQKVLVQVVVSTYDDAGELVGEQPMPPLVVYRAAEPDVWGWAERVVQQARQAEGTR